VQGFLLVVFLSRIMSKPTDGLDDIDRRILAILARDPRLPYSDIADELADDGHEMSTEGVRYRVSTLFETISILLTAEPKEHGWEVVRVMISAAGSQERKAETYDRLREMDFWMVCRVLGSSDFYAVATVPSNREADELVSRVEGIEHVTDVDYVLETGRETTTENYLAF